MQLEQPMLTQAVAGYSAPAGNYSDNFSLKMNYSDPSDDYSAPVLIGNRKYGQAAGT